MNELYQGIKVKKDFGFHNFFLIAILFHMFLFIALNLHRVEKLNIAKEAFLRFTMIKMPPAQDPVPQEEILPQRTEIKTEVAKIQETNVTKAFREVEEIKPMASMQVEERDLLRERLGSSLPDISDKMEAAGGGGGGSKLDLPSAFGRMDESQSGGPVTGWGVGSGNGIGNVSGDGVGDGFGGIGGKKDVQRYSYGQMAFKQLISGLPDWVEKSNKQIITTVRVWIDADGNVTKTEIAKSSGYLELDQLAMDSIKKRTFKSSKDGATRVALIEIDFTNIR